jgi:hypothetical protein
MAMPLFLHASPSSSFDRIILGRPPLFHSRAQHHYGLFWKKHLMVDRKIYGRDFVFILGSRSSALAGEEARKVLHRGTHGLRLKHQAAAGRQRFIGSPLV